MLRDEAFHVIIFVSWFVFVIVLGVGVGMFGSGGGCEYVSMLSKHRSDSVINLTGRKGNILWSVVSVGGDSWLWIKLYSSVCMEFLGSIMSWLFSTNVVYGCCVRMCRSGGLLRLASLIISVLVHMSLKW